MKHVMPVSATKGFIFTIFVSVHSDMWERALYLNNIHLANGERDKRKTNSRLLDVITQCYSFFIIVAIASCS